MNILGIIGFGENPSACLVKDGALVSFVAEERLTRFKGIHGVFPSKAVAWCLSDSEMNLADIDYIAFAWDAKKYPWGMVKHFGKTLLKYRRREASSFHHRKEKSSYFSALNTILEYIPTGLEGKIRDGIRAAGLAGEIPPIEFVPHHLAHAASAYYCSPFESAGILTLDGSGEDICTQLWIAKGDEIKSVESIPLPHSLGWFYAAVTQYLGFIPYRDEGKVMGLAALGETRREANRWIEPLSRVIKISTAGYEVDPVFTKFGGHFYGNRFTDEFVKLLTGVDPAARPLSYGEKTTDGMQSKYMLDTYVDLAYAAQELLEQAAIQLGRKLVQHHGINNLCVAGGVAMNCKMNGELLRRTGCHEIFVQPASSDDGSAIGAALYIAHQHRTLKRTALERTSYGPAFSNDQIRTAVKGCGVKFREIDDPSEQAAEKLANGELLGWFQEGSEFGARALGNRSILANPVIPQIKERVNREVKYRESWRPFCPSIIASQGSEYLVDPHEASFMIVAYEATKKMKDQLPAVVHVDGTVRPQLVTESANIRYYKLIEALGVRTGHPVVMNTSFNVRGEPIVNSPFDAVRCFYSCGLNSLIIGNFVLEKK